MGDSPPTPSIHFLDDDSLLNIFYLYRPAIFDGDESDEFCIQGGRDWDREQWWYKPAQVCRRWRNLILGSASYLRLCLVCKYDTPVMDMLAHSPPLPLIIDYFGDITAEDEEGIILALGLRDRVRRVRLGMPFPKLQKLIMAIDGEYPVLEYLIMDPSTMDKSTALILPEALQTPHLRHLTLRGFALPSVGCRLLTTAMGLVTLSLSMDQPSAYFHPNSLLQWITFMPQLETLEISFSFPVPSRDVERQLMHTPIMTNVTLPNLRLFLFQGISAYLEAVVRRITAPRLENLVIQFFKQLTFSVPCLLQFMNTSENLRFDSVRVGFCREQTFVEFYLREEAKTRPLFISVSCLHLDWQVSSMAQILDSFSQIFSTVEHLALNTLYHEANSLSVEEHNEVHRTEWRKLLGSLSNAKTLQIGDRLVKELSRSLRLDDGEHPLELLPELQVLTYSGGGDTGDAFTSFVDARQNAGRPVALMRSG